MMARQISHPQSLSLSHTDTHQHPHSYTHKHALPYILVLQSPKPFVTSFSSPYMRPEKNPIDLNNLPEECSQDRSQAGEQGLDESSIVAVKATKDTSKCRKKRNDRKEGKEECGKIYECRFCSLKFCKSQAIGGHMNRHRQEKEIETLNRARQLVYSSENLMESGPYLGYATILPGNFNQSGFGDPSLPFRLSYTTASSSSLPSGLLRPPSQSNFYSSSSHDVFVPAPYPSPPSTNHFIGHVHQNQNHPADSNYACIRVPVAHSLLVEAAHVPAATDGPYQDYVDGVNSEL